jgi:hypothetical protein
LQNPPEEGSGHLDLFGGTPSRCPSEKSDLELGLVGEGDGVLLILLLLEGTLVLVCLLDLLLAGRLQICNVDDGVLRRGLLPRVLPEVVVDAKRTRQGGGSQQPREALEGEQRRLALLELLE